MSVFDHFDATDWYCCKWCRNDRIFRWPDFEKHVEHEHLKIRDKGEEHYFPHLIMGGLVPKIMQPWKEYLCKQCKDHIDLEFDVDSNAQDLQRHLDEECRVHKKNAGPAAPENEPIALTAPKQEGTSKPKKGKTAGAYKHASPGTAKGIWDPSDSEESESESEEESEEEGEDKGEEESEEEDEGEEDPEQGPSKKRKLEVPKPPSPTSTKKPAESPTTATGKSKNRKGGSTARADQVAASTSGRHPPQRDQQRHRSKNHNSPSSSGSRLHITNLNADADEDEDEQPTAPVNRPKPMSKANLKKQVTEFRDLMNR